MHAQRIRNGAETAAAEDAVRLRRQAAELFSEAERKGAPLSAREDAAILALLEKACELEGHGRIRHARSSKRDEHQEHHDRLGSN